MKLMRKLLIPILAAACLLSVSFTAAFAEDGTQGSAPQADGKAALSLLLPETYEQYLELTAPSDIAIDDEYLAIADGNTIYLYDRTAGGAYKTFTYTSNVRSLNFYTYETNTYLYFTSDVSSDNPILYIDCTAADFSGQTATQTNINACSSFVINGTDVCFSNAQKTVYLTTMDDDDPLNIVKPGAANRLFEDSINTVRFSIFQNTIYFFRDKIIYTASFDAENNPESTQWTTLKQDSISSFAIVDGTCYYVAAGRFYRQNTQIAQGYDDLAAASNVVLGENRNVFLLCGDSIVEYSVQANAPTGYEIAKYSDSANRLSGSAARVSARDGKLLIADTAGDRVLQYDGNAYTVLCSEAGLAPSLVCAGDDAFAVYGNANLAVYDYEGNLKSETQIAGATGIAYSYGDFYCITGSGDTCVVSAEQGGTTKSGSVGLSNVTSVCSDIYGNLYVLNENKTVYRFTAEQFTAPPSTMDVAATFSQTVLSVQCAYDGTLYGITQDRILCHTEASDAAIPLDFSATVSGGTTATARDFAFDFENGEVYVLSDGFIVKADLDANAPASLKNIAADGLHAALHGSAADTDGLLVTVPAGSVAVQLDAGAVTQSAAVLPYADYERVESARTGVKICDIEAGTIVAFYEYTPAASSDAYPEREYTLCLILGDTAAAGGYYTAQSYGARTTNDISLLRFPTMHVGDSDNAIARLAKGTGVTVLGKVSLPASAQGGFGLDTDYVYVRASVDGETVYGYIPLGYTVENSASSGGLGTDEFVYRNVKKGESITLWMGELSLDLSDRERVKMYGEPNEEGEVFVTYANESGTWSGYVPEDSLYEAPSSATITLIVILLVTAAVLASGCYLLLRKPPMLQE